jgi:dihydroflavonol-4-reductase
MKPLVLGASGFVGSWILRELTKRNYYPSVFGRQSTDLISSIPCRFFQGDFNNYQSLSKAADNCDTIFHAAAYYPVYSLHREKQYRKAMNELETVITVAREKNIKKFIFISAPAALFASKKALNMSTYYLIKHSLHKRVEEEIIRGLPGIIIVPAGCFGPGDSKVVTGRVILEIVSRRLRMIIEGKMSIVDVRDAARSIADAAIYGRTGAIYQLTSWNCMCSDFIRKVTSLAGIPAPRIKVPYIISKSAARIIEHIQFYTTGGKPFLPETGPDMMRFGEYLDPSLAKEELGFHCLPIDKTISDAIEWFSTNNYLTKRNKINFSKLPEFNLKEIFG